ncbi:MAG: hypothetical protein OXH05_07020, partial [Acidobacteria bacterium]|nr:hypothetical protein [Acidobacteriota bacterium]
VRGAEHRGAGLETGVPSRARYAAVQPDAVRGPGARVPAEAGVPSRRAAKTKMAANRRFVAGLTGGKV